MRWALSRSLLRRSHSSLSTGKSEFLETVEHSVRSMLVKQSHCASQNDCTTATGKCKASKRICGMSDDVPHIYTDTGCIHLVTVGLAKARPNYIYPVLFGNLPCWRVPFSGQGSGVNSFRVGV